MTVLVGDCRTTLRALAAQGFRAQTCVTSPPYWGLRDYGHPGQLGLERTPEEYVAAMVEVFRCVRDVLADDGTLWLNLGDCYASTPPGNAGRGQFSKSGLNGAQSSASYRNTLEHSAGQKRNTITGGLKPKDLVGIPWRVAFALQADGWYLRSDIIWHKPNPMPESVTDRPTKAHEYLFLMSKAERYYYDAKAITEESVGRERFGNKRKKGFCDQRQDNDRRDMTLTEIRNRRTVWTVATQPYSGAHFATFPPALIEPCILAGSRPGDVVLDPFLGSGTTGMVAQRLGRQWVGCELNPDYVALAGERTAGTMGLAL